jgi:hypothetical protein
MLAFRTTGRLIQTYAESDPRTEGHDRAMWCRAIEEILGWGIRLLRGLAEIEAELQARALGGKVAPSDPVWAEHDRAYRSWVAGSEGFLKAATELSEEGYDVHDLDEFRRAVEEARCQVELWELESELPTIEEMRPLARPQNPRPARYGT